MAEIAVKTYDSANYLDRDLVQPFNDHMISCCHASVLTKVHRASFNSSGLRDIGTVYEDWYILTHQYKFTRTGRNTVDRLDQLTTDVEDVSALMDVALYLQRRKRHPKHRIFGTTGAEIWYGGRKDMSLSVLTDVWLAIESKTDFRQSVFRQWPFSPAEFRQFLILPVTDFDDNISISYGQSNGVATRFVDWPSLSIGRTDSDVRDSDIPVDVRDLADFDHTVIVEPK